MAPIIAVQRLVYGQRAIAAQTAAAPGIAAPLLQRMRAAGFTPRLEQAHGPFWVAYVITASATTHTTQAIAASQSPTQT